METMDLPDQYTAYSKKNFEYPLRDFGNDFPLHYTNFILG